MYNIEVGGGDKTRRRQRDDDCETGSYSLREVRVDHLHLHIYSLPSEDGKRFYDQAAKLFLPVDFFHSFYFIFLFFLYLRFFLLPLEKIKKAAVRL